MSRAVPQDKGPDPADMLSMTSPDSSAPFSDSTTAAVVQNLKALPHVLGDTLFTNEGWKRSRRRTSADQALDKLLGDVMTRQPTQGRLTSRSSVFSWDNKSEASTREGFAIDEMANFSIFAEEGEMPSFPVIRFLSPFAVCLDRMRILFGLWTLVYTPMMLAFHRLPSFSWDQPVAFTMDTVGDVLFLMGSLLAPITTVASSQAGREYVAARTIWKKRLRSPFFWCDALSCIPFLFGIFTGQVDPSSRLTLLLLKLLRIHWVLCMPASHFETRFQSLLQVVRMFVWIVLSMHLMACMWYAVVVANDTEEKHLRAFPKVSEVTHYLVALKHGAYLVSGKPTEVFSDDELLIIAISSPLFGIFFAFIFGNTTMLLTRMNILMSKHHKHVALIQSTMRSLDIPPELRNRITRYHHFLAVHHNINAYKLLMQGLSVNLFIELKAHLFRKMFSEGKFFRDAPGGFLRRLLQVMVEATFCPGDIVVRCGDLGDQMYFVVKGKLDVLSAQSAVIGKISENQYFGEIALLISTPRLVSIRATTYCLLAMICRDKFLPILEAYQEQKQRMYESMAEYKYSGASSQAAATESDDELCVESPSASDTEHEAADSVDAGLSREIIPTSTERRDSIELVKDLPKSQDNEEDCEVGFSVRHSLPLNVEGFCDSKKQDFQRRRKSTSMISRDSGSTSLRGRSSQHSHCGTAKVPRASTTTLPKLVHNAHQQVYQQVHFRAQTVGQLSSTSRSSNEGRRESSLSGLSTQLSQILGSTAKKTRINTGRPSVSGLSSWLAGSSKATNSESSRNRRVSCSAAKGGISDNPRNRRESCSTAMSNHSEGNLMQIRGQGVMPAQGSCFSLIGSPAQGTILRPSAAPTHAEGEAFRDSAKWSLVGDLVLDRLDELDSDLKQYVEDMEERLVIRLGDRYEQPLQKLVQQVRRIEDVLGHLARSSSAGKELADGIGCDNASEDLDFVPEVVRDVELAIAGPPGSSAVPPGSIL